MIWLLAALLALVAIASLAAPWWWSAFAQRAGLKRRSANVAAYRDRLRELEADVAAGVLPADAVAAAKQELDARLLDDVTAPGAPALAAAPSRGLLLLLALAVVAFTGTWYALAGSWRTQALVELSEKNPELARSAAIDAAIEKLRKTVESRPDDADAWAWLGRSYRDRGNFADAAQALGRASEIKGRQDPDLLVEEGEALAYAQDRAMAGAPAQRFTQALAIAPEHPQGLWYAGIAALQAGDDRGAIGYWERLLRQPLPDDTRATLEHSLARLRERAGLPAATPESRPPAPAATAASVALTLEVSVAPELAPEVRRDAALFVFAAEAGGPPMPLAVQRLTAGALPAQVTLDDSNSMTPARKLSSVSRWRVTARISRTGNAAPQPGDLEGSVEIDRGAAGKPVRVVIDRRRS